MDSAVHDTEYKIVREGRVEWLAFLVLYVLTCCMEMVVRACPPIWCCMLRPSLIRLSELPFAHSSRLGGRCDHWLWIWYVASKA